MGNDWPYQEEAPGQSDGSLCHTQWRATEPQTIIRQSDNKKDGLRTCQALNKASQDKDKDRDKKKDKRQRLRLR